MKAPRSVLALTLLLSAPSFAQPAADTVPLPGQTPEWVTRSNQYSRILLDAQASFQPEHIVFFRLTEHDLHIADLKPQHQERYRAAVRQARTELDSRLASEQDPNVRYDLQILLHAADQQIQESELEEKRLLPWIDVPRLVFEGISNILSEQTPAAQRDIALVRLQQYTGLLPGTRPITHLAQDRYEEKRSDQTLLPPTQAQVAQALASTDLYVDGIQSLFKKFGIADADEALYAIAMQLHGHSIWVREHVLPTARASNRIPPDLYAQSLREFGIDLDPRELVSRAEIEFAETRTAMQQLVPLISMEQDIEINDYREVIRAQGQRRVDLDYPRNYPETDDELSNPIVARERLANAMEYAMRLRLNMGSKSAASPPHMMNVVWSTKPPLAEEIALSDGIGNGNRPYFNDGVTGGPNLPDSPAEFQSMSERGVSLAHSMFSFNMVNTDGWSMYAEAEMLPYAPLDGQMTALQFRLLRAARAMLDPMLNMGYITREQAAEILREDVQLPESLVNQELDRYQLLPGQAASYLYGYHRLQSLRVETELALGDGFDRRAFNDFLLEQGLLPPDQLADAVRTIFVPSQRAGTAAARPKRVAATH